MTNIQAKKEEEVINFATLNCTVHLLFLIESLLLKRVYPVVTAGKKSRKTHLAVEKFRPSGINKALEAAELACCDRKKALALIWEICLDTAAKHITEDRLKELITSTDLDNIYELLLMLKESDTCIVWGKYF